MKDIIEIQHLKFRYDDESRYVLKNINLQIKSGEFIAILGHNGSGKSTLAKLINTQFFPSEGDILVDSLNTKEEKNMWEIRSRCGMVFQNPDNQIVATIVEEDVAFGPENLGVPMPELRRRVDWALDVVGMTEYKRHSPALLSGGQKQRVAIAGVLAMDCDCIVFDEPTAMLDPVGRREIVATIEKLHQMGKTIIYITHHMEECVNADRIVVMNEGEIVLQGKPRDIFSKVEMMKNLGLDVPQVTELSYLLYRAGFCVSPTNLTVDELVSAL